MSTRHVVVAAIEIAGCGARRVKAYIWTQCLGCIGIHDFNDGSNGLCSWKAKKNNQEQI
jgi:hypothetical protein